MDFLQHFLIGKPLEENGQDSLGVITALQTVVFDDMQLLAGIDLELADGFLKETQDGPATDGAPPANAIRPAGKHYDYEVQSKVAALYGQIEQPFAERFKLTVGGRLEYVDYDYDNRMLAGNTRDDGTACGADRLPVQPARGPQRHLHELHLEARPDAMRSLPSTSYM